MRIDLTAYRAHRARMVSGTYDTCGSDGIRAHRVHGDLIRHCDLHRDMQRSLVALRAAYYG
jgi:hypothetical protein